MRALSSFDAAKWRIPLRSFEHSAGPLAHFDQELQAQTASETGTVVRAREQLARTRTPSQTPLFATRFMQAI
jgi:hypothetical protein